MKKTKKKLNRLIISASETDANLYYATRFVAPDPFIFTQIRGKKYLFMSDLEVDRAQKQAQVDYVISTSVLARKFLKRTGRTPNLMDLVESFLKEKKVQDLCVPADFPVAYADVLRKRGLRIIPKPDPFFEERTVKTKQEVRSIEHAIRQVEKAVKEAIGVLKKSVIKKGRLYYHGELLTSEKIKQIINLSLMKNHCIGAHSIVACGKHAVDPHDEGSGPLYADQSIIMDIFPRNMNSRYYADFTRTVVRGKASPKLKRMYQAVWEGQKIAFKKIRAGVDAGTIHESIHRRFEELGFKTGRMGGRMQGFFHGTGHGLGLDIHEAPSFGGRKEILKAGYVITVEPGLYYEGVGGVRLEDVVVVTRTGCRNLTRFPKFLEI